MIIVIIGFTGQGKSTLALHLARRADTRVIFDPRTQFTGYNVLPDAAGLYSLLDTEAEIIVQPGRGRDVGIVFDETCSALAEWIEDNPLERVALLDEEARLTGLDSKAVSLNFDWIVRSAREGSPIDVIITCHRPVDCSTNIRAISNRIILFQVKLPLDLGVIEEQCGDEVAERVKSLLDRQFLTWNNSRQQFRLVTDPASWFVRISESPTVGSV